MSQRTSADLPVSWSCVNFSKSEMSPEDKTTLLSLLCMSNEAFSGQLGV